jgi:hypothetical protein
MAAGIDPDAPVPFRIAGRVVTATRPRAGQAGRPAARAGPPRGDQGRVPLADEPVDIIGFSSARHQGIFVPMDSTLHAHAVARDGWTAGHVDALHLAPGWRLATGDTASAVIEASAVMVGKD